MSKLSGLRNGVEERRDWGRKEGREGDRVGGTVGKCSRDVHGITASVSTLTKLAALHSLQLYFQHSNVCKL